MAVNRAALQNQRIRQAIIQSYPSPFGGINTVSALAAMPQQDAVDMVNFFPDVGQVKVRKGYELYAQVSDGSDIETVVEYNSGSEQHLLGADSSGIYNFTDVSDSGFDPPAIDFASNGYLSHDAAITGLSDTIFAVTMSLWFSRATTDSQQVVFSMADSGDATGNGLQIRLLADNTLNFYVYAAGNPNPNDALICTTVTTFDDTDWHHLVFSYDVGTGDAYLYIDDVAQTLTNLPGSLEWGNAVEFALGARVLNSSGSPSYDNIFGGKVSEFYLTNEFIDLSVAANREKFRTSLGEPAFLGADGSLPTGTAPILYFGNPPDQFQVNKGSGPDFTETGTNTLDAGPTGLLVNVKTGTTEGRWQVVDFNGLQFWCNGADTPLTYNGTAFSNSTITGPTIANLVGCNVYRNRLYVWEEDSQDVWYGATNAIGGAFTKFPLSRVGKKGGKLIAMANWTIDGGDGADDMAVFIMSTGETLVYQGPDPSQWAIVGIYQIGKPLGVRAVTKVGGDVLIATQEDYVFLGDVLKDRGKVRSKISGAARDASAQYAANAGWQVTYHPKGGFVLVNIPVSSTEFEQHVLNVVTNAWTKFDGMNARAWGTFDGDIYFGGADGAIYKADTGNSDNGTAITSHAQTAWQKSPVNAQAVGFAPYFTSSVNVDYTLETAFDYGDPGNSQDITYVPDGDNDCLLDGEGKAISHKITTTTSAELGWASYDTRFRKGSQV